MIIYYLFTGNAYLLVGYESEGINIGLNHTQKLYVKVNLNSRDFLSLYPEAFEILSPVQGGKHFLSKTLVKTPMLYESVLDLFKVGVKVLLPDDCKVFTEDDRRLFQSMNFHTVFSFEDGVLCEKAQYSIETKHGIALLLTTVASVMDVKSETVVEDYFQFLLHPLFQKVVWKTTVNTLEEAQVIYNWAKDHEDAAYVRIGFPEYGIQREGFDKPPVIVKIPFGDRIWVCFLNTRDNKLPEDQIVGKPCLVKFTPPENGKTSGRFDVKEIIPV